MHVTAVLTRSEEGGYIAYNPESGTTTEGETIDHALDNLREAVELFLEEFPLRLVGTPLVTTLDVAVDA